MKIKELHLRNIASIEKADIDFERDLVDGITGDPASIFLISGDTGAGKSIILDGISMALYKKTPRISGVANVKNNEFTDAEGESIRVGSIEQYTRLGISDKDECYSEVAFTGNDGVEYRAKLSLGMLLGNTDKATGKRPLKHRKPVWEVKIGSADWTRDSVENTILSAVGLSFEQFGRMAMLAQGQFAAFLTGDKKEREEILEQLTNTALFSDYGKAIKSLFDKAKSHKEKVQTEYDTEFQHTLAQEKVDELTKDKTELEAEKAALDKKVKENEAVLELVKAVGKARETADSESEKKRELEAVVGSKEYKSKKALVADWDATVTERQRLMDLKSAKERLSKAKEETEMLKRRFEALSSDLSARKEALASMGDPKKAVDEKQAEIDTLTQQREALKPAEVNAALSGISARRTALGALSSGEQNLSDKVKELTSLRGEIAKDEKEVEEKKSVYASAQNEYESARKATDETKDRLATMSTSIEDTIVSIRKRLVSEHAEICPLCGSHIHEIPLEDDFKAVLTPFEKADEEAKKKLVAAEKARDEALKEYNRLEGALKTKKTSRDSLEKMVRVMEEKLRMDAGKAGLDAERPLKAQIAAVIEELIKEEAALKVKQSKAEELQTIIAEARKAKLPLDAALKKYNDEKGIIDDIEASRGEVMKIMGFAIKEYEPKPYPCQNIKSEWSKLLAASSGNLSSIDAEKKTIAACIEVLEKYYSESGKTESELEAIAKRKGELETARTFIKETDANLKSRQDAVDSAEAIIREALEKLGIQDEKDVPQKERLLSEKEELQRANDELVGKINVISEQLRQNSENSKQLKRIEAELDKATASLSKWNILNSYFGGLRFRTLVQTYILRPLLNNANVYLRQITDRYRLTCSEDNEQLSILVLDKYNKDQIRSVTVLSGGERFMISLALSLALSSLNRPDMNVNILFIDEGFGTLDEKSLDSVMATLEKLQEIAGQSERRVGIISHREELDERIPVQICVEKKGEGRSVVKTVSRC